MAVDCANGSASATARKLFSELGAECHLLFCEPDGININDACGSTHTEALARYVVDNGLDAGVAFDGDADRCLCVDENGELVDGDMIMAICALDMKKRGKLSRNTVVGTVMTNLGFIKFCEANGIRFNTTKVGDRYVLEEMLLEEYDFGGEQSPWSSGFCHHRRRTVAVQLLPDAAGGQKAQRIEAGDASLSPVHGQRAGLPRGQGELLHRSRHKRCGSQGQETAE